MFHHQVGTERLKLAQAVQTTLGSFLGTGLPAYESDLTTKFSPIVAGVLAAALYALIPLLEMFRMPRSRELILLSWWGTIYLGIVVALTRSTSLAVTEIIQVLVLPNMSEQCAKTVREDIGRRFVRPRIIMKSLAVSGVAIFISIWILRAYPWVDLAVWGLGFFILYFTASQATLTAPFYTCFSHSLKDHSDDLFPSDPAASPAVSACTALAKRILYYWFGVFALVMSMMALPFASGFVGASSANVARFISTVVIVAGFFSFAFGSLVYLRFEGDLRTAVERARLATLSRVQARYCDLFSKQGTLSADDWVQLDRLQMASDRLAKSGRLRSSVHNLGTVTAALLPPVVSIVGAVLTYKKPH